MIPDLGPDPEFAPPDDYDAYAIWDMDQAIRSGHPTMSVPSAYAYNAWPHPELEPIEFCWQNEAAWEILGGDVDRARFMKNLEASGDGGVPDSLADLEWDESAFTYDGS